jgi:hypothetical protein
MVSNEVAQPVAVCYYVRMKIVATKKMGRPRDLEGIRLARRLKDENPKLSYQMIAELMAIGRMNLDPDHFNPEMMFESEWVLRRETDNFLGSCR